MRLPGSLGGRLMVGAALFIVLALLVAGAVIGIVLDRFVRRQIDERLDGQLHTVAAALRPGPDGAMDLGRNVDAPPFDRIGSGWYWQVQQGGRIVLRSRSLDAEELPPVAGTVPLLPAPPPPPPLSPDGHRHMAPPSGRPPRPPPPMALDLAGPFGEPLHARAASVPADPDPATIVASAPVAALIGPLREILTTVGLSLAALGALFVMLTPVQVRLGLRPLRRLQGDLAAIRQGRLDRIPSEQPDEVRPLVAELNALLQENAENLVLARRHVANLAHGLKTPLASLTVALDEQGRDPGGQYHALLGLMDRQIRHHLSRARSAAQGGTARTRSALRPATEELLAAFAKIHADRRLSFDLGMDPDLAVACDRQDLDEMLGNLLDNACKWARGQVAIAAVREGRDVRIAVEDDGHGLSPDAMPDALRPGRRLDESTPGYGFGLSITRELAELYGGTLALETAGLGGLRAVLVLPGASG